MHLTIGKNNRGFILERIIVNCKVYFAIDSLWGTRAESELPHSECFGSLPYQSDHLGSLLIAVKETIKDIIGLVVFLKYQIPEASSKGQPDGVGSCHDVSTVGNSGRKGGCERKIVAKGIQIKISSGRWGTCYVHNLRDMVSLFGCCDD